MSDPASKPPTEPLKGARVPEPERLKLAAVGDLGALLGGRVLPPEGATTPAPALPCMGKYPLMRELGRGGIGVVYLSRHPALQTPCAVKVLRPETALLSPESTARLLTEARAVARLSHPGIVRVLDAGEHEGKTYLVMELVDGANLGEVLKDPRRFGLEPAGGAGRGLAPATAIRLMERIARAVQAAHEGGVLHRDLKPVNVVLDRNGRLKVMDFGLARLLDVNVSRATLTGAVFGTPAYMSPEQADGRTREIDQRSDVYQLGATLYELLTGRVPYDGEPSLQVLYRVLNEDPLPPRKVDPGIDPIAETVCLTAMARDRDRRYDSAGTLAEECRRYLAGEAIRARPENAVQRLLRWVRRRKAITLLSAVVLLQTPLLIHALLRDRTPAPDASVAPIGTPTASNPAPEPGPEPAPAEPEPGQPPIAGRKPDGPALQDLRELATACLAKLDLGGSRLPTETRKHYLEETARLAKVAAAEDPEAAEPHYWLGRVCRRAMDYDRARRELGAALEQEPGFDAARWELAVLSAHECRQDWVRRRRWARLEWVLAARRGSPGPVPEVEADLTATGRAFEGLVAARKQPRWLEHPVKALRPGEPQLAWIEGMQALRGEIPAAQGRKTLEPGSPDGDPILCEVLWHLAMQAKVWKEAAQACVIVLEKDPGYAPLALCFLEARVSSLTVDCVDPEPIVQFPIEVDFPTARDQAEVWSSRGGAWLWLGALRTWTIKDPTGVIELVAAAHKEFGRAVEADSSCVEALVGRGDACAWLGELLPPESDRSVLREEALSSYRKALGLAPDRKEIAERLNDEGG